MAKCEEPGAAFYPANSKGRRHAARFAERNGLEVWSCPCGGLHVKKIPQGYSGVDVAL